MSADSNATRFYRLAGGTQTARTGMGLVSRRGVRRTGGLDEAFEANYAPVAEGDLLDDWLPGRSAGAPARIAVITAHDDDLLSFCGVLAKWAAERPVEIHHLILTDGSMGFGEAALREVASEEEIRAAQQGLLREASSDDPGYLVRGGEAATAAYADLLRRAGERTAAVRQAEAREAERILGFHSTCFLGFQDAALSLCNASVDPAGRLGATALTLRLVRDIGPDLMILQDRTQVIDLNPDHYAAGMIGYTVYWHLHCPVLGVDASEKPVKAVIQRGFEGIGRPEFRFPETLVHLDDRWLKRKFDSLAAYKNQQELVDDLFNTGEADRWRVEAFFDVDLPPAAID